MPAETVSPPEEPKGDSKPAKAVVIKPPRAEKQTAGRSRSRGAASTKKAPDLEQRLIDFFGEYKIKELEGGMQVPYCTGLAGMGWIFNPNDGLCIAANSHNMARAWSNLAAQNERVRRALEWMMAGGAWGEVFWATSPVLLGIMANHGVTLATFGLGAPATESDGTADGGDTDQTLAAVPPSVP
jgi:hypothetical protein